MSAEKHEKMWRVRCSVHTHRRLQQIAIRCKRSNYNKFFQKWAPPVFSPLPPWSTGRRRRISPLVLMKRNWFWSFFSRFTVETVHKCKCFSEVWSEIIGAFLPDLCSEKKPVFQKSFIFLRGWAVRVVFLCQLEHYDALLLGPANFELWITIYWISLEAIVNSIKFLFETSPPRVVRHKMLFLCVGFAVPSTTRSPFLMT